MSLLTTQRLMKNSSYDREAPCEVCNHGELQFPLKMAGEIRDSARGGCQVCRVITECLEVTYRHDGKVDYEVLHSLDRGGSMFILRPIQAVINATEKISSGPLSRMPVLRDISPELYNQRGQYLAKLWLDECLKSHSLCSKSYSTNPPTRLLDTAPHEPDIGLRLIVCDANKHANIEYAALSHCWGKEDALRTTRVNLEAMFQEIREELLPRTFKDAVMLCREFGIRYLWIDSLCIIQGDDSDWENEAGRMTTVYSNALLVLVASMASGHNTGIFPKRRNHYCHKLDIGPANNRLSLKIEPMKSHYQGSIGAEAQGPLSLRAWAFQERLLARRAICYNEDELVWECNEGWKCECGFATNPEYGPKSNHLYDFNKMLPQSQSQSDIRKLYRSWQLWICVPFTHRQLTYRSDRLPAISGVAKLFEKELDDTYLAGLWKKNLPSDLCWYVDYTDNKLLPVGDQYNGPSWSWVSIESPARYDSITIDTTWIEIHEATCILKGKNTTGEVSDGWITVSGRLTPVMVEVQADYVQNSLYLKDEVIHICSRELEKCVVGTKVHLDSRVAVAEVLVPEGTKRETATRAKSIPQRGSVNATETTQGKVSEVDSPLFAPAWCLRVAQTKTRTRHWLVERGFMAEIYLILGLSEKRPGKLERLGQIYVAAEAVEYSWVLDGPAEDSRHVMRQGSFHDKVTIV